MAMSHLLANNSEVSDALSRVTPDHRLDYRRPNDGDHSIAIVTEAVYSKRETKWIARTTTARVRWSQRRRWS